MALHVRIGDPAYLGELVAALNYNGCVAERVAEDACLVIHVFAGDSEEALQELEFFVKAWELTHRGLAAEVSH
jgi:hypothetical protein